MPRWAGWSVMPRKPAGPPRCCVRLLGGSDARAMSSQFSIDVHQLGGWDLGGVCALAAQYADAVEQLQVMEQRLKEFEL